MASSTCKSNFHLFWSQTECTSSIVYAAVYQINKVKMPRIKDISEHLA
uniref:Uncharacterized protein n=1 Tax=Manihot esculenta TaxID=3983 RepID=A0A2C9UWD4_MANES